MKNIVMLSCFTLGLIDVSCTSCNHSNANPVAGVKTHFISDSTMAMLKIEPATTRNLEEEVKLSGTVSFDENKVVKVFAFSSGQVVSVNAGVGDFVKQGQPLAVIRSADIAGNYSDLSVAGNDVAISKRTMDNAGQLYQNGIASEKEYIEARENYLKAVANRNKIEKQIHINGGGHTTASGSYIITAPRS